MTGYQPHDETCTNEKLTVSFNPVLNEGFTPGIAFLFAVNGCKGSKCLNAISCRLSYCN